MARLRFLCVFSQVGCRAPLSTTPCTCRGIGSGRGCNTLFREFIWFLSCFSDHKTRCNGSEGNSGNARTIYIASDELKHSLSLGVLFVVTHFGRVLRVQAVNLITSTPPSSEHTTFQILKLMVHRHFLPEFVSVTLVWPCAIGVIVNLIHWTAFVKHDKPPHVTMTIAYINECDRAYEFTVHHQWWLVPSKHDSFFLGDAHNDPTLWLFYCVLLDFRFGIFMVQQTSSCWPWAALSWAMNMVRDAQAHKHTAQYTNDNSCVAESKRRRLVELTKLQFEFLARARARLRW